jgi:hypothetical protein
MAGARGRKHRVGVGDAVALRVRVHPERHAKAEAAAAALGISVAAYVDLLLANEQLDEHGRPVWWTGPAPVDQEVLPTFAKSA